MKKIVSSPRHFTNSETALKYREAIGADRHRKGDLRQLEDQGLPADPPIKTDLRERFCHFGKIRSNDKLKQHSRYLPLERTLRTGYLDSLEDLPPNQMTQTSPAQLHTAHHATKDESAQYSSLNFRQKFKEEYRRCDPHPLRFDHRHKNSPQLARQYADKQDDLRNPVKPDHSLHSELKVVKDNIAMLTDQLSKIMPIIGSLAEKGFPADKPALSEDGQVSEVFDYRKKDKECLSVQLEPYSNGFWDKQRNPKPTHIKSGISTEGKQDSYKSIHKHAFATQNHFEDDRQSKTESSPVSKSSIQDIEIDRLSHQQLVDLREKVEFKLRQSQYEQSDIGSQDNHSDFRKRNPHITASIISSSIKPPVVPTAATNSFHERKVLLNPRDTSSNAKMHSRLKQTDPHQQGNPS